MRGIRAIARLVLAVVQFCNSGLNSLGIEQVKLLNILKINFMRKGLLDNFFDSCLLVMLMLFLGSCENQSKTEKIQTHRNKVIVVEDNLKDIETPVILGSPMLYVISDYLIVLDIKPSTDRGIHLFEKKTFKYVTSTGLLGHGPGEIIRYGRLGIDSENRVFWVPDHGKQMLWKFPLDSVFKNPNFKPTQGLSLLNDLFIERFQFVDDSVALGKAVNVLSSSSYQMVMAKLNTKTNKTGRYGYEHPEVTGKKSNSYFALSNSENLYVNCYTYCDLMTICSMNGSLQYNVYGPDRLENKENRKTYFTGVAVLNEFIVASYIGEDGIVTNEFKRQEGNLPSKFLIFDKSGSYLYTLETKHKFSSFCVDGDNNRIIAHYMDKANPLAYFSFDSSSASGQ